MDKKIIILLIIAVLVGVGSWWLIQAPREETAVKVLPSHEKQVKAKGVVSAWSVA